MLFRSQRALVVCVAAGLLVGISSVAYAQEEPPVEEAEPVVVDDEEGTRPLPRDEEGTRPLPGDDERPVPTPASEDPGTDVVIAPAPDGVVEPAPVPTAGETVISPGGETIGIEEDEGFSWLAAGAIAAAVVAAVLAGWWVARSIRMHRGHPLPY